MTFDCVVVDDDACGATERRQKFVRHVRGNQDAVPTLFISADTDEATMRIRAAACLMQTECKRGRGDDATSASTIVDHEMENLDEFMFWVLESQPSMEDIEEEILAVNEVLGYYPQL